MRSNVTFVKAVSSRLEVNTHVDTGYRLQVFGIQYPTGDRQGIELIAR